MGAPAPLNLFQEGLQNQSKKWTRLLSLKYFLALHCAKAGWALSPTESLNCTYFSCYSFHTTQDSKVSFAYSSGFCKECDAILVQNNSWDAEWVSHSEQSSILSNSSWLYFIILMRDGNSRNVQQCCNNIATLLIQMKLY